MNWAKAKTILIIALLVTDIFLIFTYGRSFFAPEGFKDNKALAEFLSQKNIYIDAGIIPKKHGDMPVLYVKDADSGGMRELLMESGWRAGGDGDEDYIKEAGAFIKAAGADFNTAEFYGIERGNNFAEVVFKNTVDNVPVENNSITCIFKDGALEDFTCDWFKVIRIHNKPQKTISAAQALLLFMAREHGDADIYISGIEMVYWLDESVQIDMPVSEDTAFPTWKITYNDGDFDYIDAYEHN